MSKCRGVPADLTAVERRCRECQIPMLAENERLHEVMERDQVTLKHMSVQHEQMGDALKTVLLITKQLHTRFVDCSGFRSLDVSECVPVAQKRDPAAVAAIRAAIAKQKFRSDVFAVLKKARDWNVDQVYEAEFDFNGQSVRVLAVYWGGAEPCPFLAENVNHGFQYGGADVFVVNLSSAASFQYSSLLPHMIKHHHFFEGQQSRYRLNPEAVCKVLGPLQRPSYKIQTIGTYRSWLLYTMIENFTPRTIGRVVTSDPDWRVRFSGLKPRQEKKTPYKRYGAHVLFALGPGQVLMMPATRRADCVGTEARLFDAFTETAARVPYFDPQTLYYFAQRDIKLRQWSDWLPDWSESPQCYQSMLTKYHRFIYGKPGAYIEPRR